MDSNSRQLTSAEIAAEVEAGNTVELMFETLVAAENCKNNVLSKIYKDRATMKKACDVEFESVVASIESEDAIWKLSFKLAPKQSILYRCTIIRKEQAGDSGNG